MVQVKQVCNSCPMKSDLYKKIDNNTKRAVKIRLEAMLAEELKVSEYYEQNVKPKLNPTRRAAVERYKRKRIQALRIVIYMCTPTMEKIGDIPNLFDKLTILFIILLLLKTTR